MVIISENRNDFMLFTLKFFENLVYDSFLDNHSVRVKLSLDATTHGKDDNKLIIHQMQI